METNTITRCLVIGGKGFIGSHIVDGLLAAGYAVRLFDRPDVYTPYLPAHHPLLETVDGDFTCCADIVDALEQCDICLHLASTTLPKSSNLDPVFDIETNLLGTVKLLQHAVAAKVKKMIFLSSGGTVYGTPQHLPINEDHQTNPICSYGINKLAIEKYLGLFYQLENLDYVVLRLSNPFGERQRLQASQGAVAVFLGKALRGETIEIWGDGSVIRDYIYIADVVTAVLAAINYQGNRHVFNIGSGQGVCINELLDTIETVVNKPLTRIYKPSRSFDVPVNVLAIEKAQQELEWQLNTSLLAGIQSMAHWLEQHI